jgi:prolyl-tRNA synthetase
VLRKIEQIVHEEQAARGPHPDADADLPARRSVARERALRRLRAGDAAHRDRHDRDMLYGPTNEEMITDIFRAHVGSYRTCR